MTKNSFLESEKAVKLRAELEEMVKSSMYNTRVVTLLDQGSSYFVDKHMRYMSHHLTMDHFQYVKNLRLMTKVR